MIKDYGKHVFTDKDGNLWVAQPKSFTKANEREKKELFSLLFSGEYVLVITAIPRQTQVMGKEEK